MHDPCHSKQVTCYDWPGRQGEAARVLSSAARQVAGVVEQRPYTVTVGSRRRGIDDARFHLSGDFLA